MQKLKMKTTNKVEENVDYIANRFPNCLTEVVKDGKAIKAIDFELLKAELSHIVIDGDEERYQFTWPDKRKSILLANSPVNKTLRPCKEESVNFDTTQNLYIEGDNLDVLKLLQETYMGKVKMIYIDPPYNTGNDFVYEDDFAMSSEEYFAKSGQSDEDNNRLFQNNDSNGRFHTDWLNMIYPRLKLARDLLTDDGVILISIDDNEQANLKKVCDEVFGASNFVAQLVWEKKKKGAFLSKHYINMKEYILAYARNTSAFSGLVGEINDNDETYPCIKQTNARGIRIIKKGTISKFREKNHLVEPNTRISAGNMELIYLDKVIIQNGTLQADVRVESNWIYSQSKLDEYAEKQELYITQDLYIRRIVTEDRTKKLKDLLLRVGSDGVALPNFRLDTNLHNGGWGTNEDANDELHQLLGVQNLFDFTKPSRLITKFTQAIDDKKAIILDFFSGSATTAHAVMQLNAKDSGNRKFIMVQLPEETTTDSEAFKAGYKNICEIGKERIRRAGAKIADENRMTSPNIDIGFRVLKLDNSNMKDVYYQSTAYSQDMLDTLEGNIKTDRTPQDLLFQVMLDMGVLLSSKIEEKEIAGKKVFIVNEDDLICCFDSNLNDEVVTTIAKMKPQYAVFRDSSFANDSVATNFEQIFATYSPTTEKKVI